MVLKKILSDLNPFGANFFYSRAPRPTCRISLEIPLCAISFKICDFERCAPLQSGLGFLSYTLDVKKINAYQEDSKFAADTDKIPYSAKIPCLTKQFYEFSKKIREAAEGCGFSPLEVNSLLKKNPSPDSSGAPKVRSGA